MKLCDMTNNEIENKYGAMIRKAGYPGTVDMINSLNLWGSDENDLVAACREPELYDSDTGDALSALDLGMTPDEYTAAINESLDSSQPEGHIRLANGRRVFAL